MTPSQEAREHPPLPAEVGVVREGHDGYPWLRIGAYDALAGTPEGAFVYTADQMRSYVDADRKAQEHQLQTLTLARQEDKTYIERLEHTIESDRKVRQQDAQAWVDVLAERRRQVEAEGWTAEHDDEHDSGEMAGAASAYALAAADKLHPMSQGDGEFDKLPPAMWPWDYEWWKPGEPRRMLVKAGALILAEIERLDRAAIAKGEQSHE